MSSTLVPYIGKTKTSDSNTISTSPKGHFSIEFFPAKSEVAEKQFTKVYNKLASLKPEYFSVTYGAGGSTKERTFKAVEELVRKTSIPTAPHISCVGESKEDLSHLLGEYKKLGINRLVVLRGDLPSGMGRQGGDFKYARDLVRFIRDTTGEYFNIAVAAYPEMHPQAKSYDQDVEYFCEKVKEGADSAVTQFFYNADSYCYFVDECLSRGVTIPIVPGIMPIYNRENLIRFADGCGAEIPRWVRLKMDSFAEEGDLVRFGEDVVVRLCERLIREGVPGLHFYSLNKAESIKRIWARL